MKTKGKVLFTYLVVAQGVDPFPFSLDYRTLVLIPQYRVLVLTYQSQL